MSIAHERRISELEHEVQQLKRVIRETDLTGLQQLHERVAELERAAQRKAAPKPKESA
jgi:hypothetical protein